MQAGINDFEKCSLIYASQALQKCTSIIWKQSPVLKNQLTHLSMIHINLNKPAAAEGGVTVMICQPGEHSGWY